MTNTKNFLLELFSKIRAGNSPEMIITDIKSHDENECHIYFEQHEYVSETETTTAQRCIIARHNPSEQILQLFAVLSFGKDSLDQSRAKVLTHSANRANQCCYFSKVFFDTDDEGNAEDETDLTMVVLVSLPLPTSSMETSGRPALIAQATTLLQQLCTDSAAVYKICTEALDDAGMPILDHDEPEEKIGTVH